MYKIKYQKQVEANFTEYKEVVIDFPDKSLSDEYMFDKYNSLLTCLCNSFKESHLIFVVIGSLQDDLYTESRERRLEFIRTHSHEKNYFEEENMGKTLWIFRYEPVYSFMLEDINELNILTKDWYTSEWEGVNLIFVKRDDSFQMNMEVIKSIAPSKDKLRRLIEHGIDIICSLMYIYFDMTVNNRIANQVEKVFSDQVR